MSTLTETRIEIADRHTTLCFLRDPPADGALGKHRYEELYARVDSIPEADFRQISNTVEDPVLDRLRSVCNIHNQRFWREYLGFDFYPAIAANEALPIIGAMSDFVSIDVAVDYTIKVAPLVNVLLFPFGWSTWISLRLTRNHKLDDVELLLNFLFQGKSILLHSTGQALTLNEFFDYVAARIRDEVFAGNATHDTVARDTIAMTTVLSKFGGSPSLGAMQDKAKDQMKSLVAPRGKLSERPFTEHVFSLSQKKKGLNYLVFDNLGRFTWLENLLDPSERNHQHLTCYHSNNFFSLVQAWQFEGLLSAAVKEASPSDQLSELADVARDRLSNPTRKNAGLMVFLQSPAVLRAIKQWEEKTNPPKSGPH